MCDNHGDTLYSARPAPFIVSIAGGTSTARVSRSGHRAVHFDPDPVGGRPAGDAEVVPEEDVPGLAHPSDRCHRVEHPAHDLPEDPRIGPEPGPHYHETGPGHVRPPLRRFDRSLRPCDGETRNRLLEGVREPPPPAVPE